MIPNTIGNNLRIAESQLVILINQVLLVGSPTFRSIFLGLKERRQFTGFMRLGKSTLLQETTFNFGCLQEFISFNIDMAHFHFLLLVDEHIQDDLILSCHILTLVNGDFSVLITLVVKVLLGQNFGTVDRVGRELQSLEQTQFRFHVLPFRLLQAQIVDGRHTRAHFQGDMQIGFVAHQRVDIQLNLREKTMFPITLHGIRDYRTREFHLLPHSQSGDTREHIVFIAFHTRNIDTANRHGARCSGICHFRILYLILCLHPHTTEQCYKCKPYLIYIIHFHLDFLLLSVPLSSQNVAGVAGNYE